MIYKIYIDIVVKDINLKKTETFLKKNNINYIGIYPANPTAKSNHYKVRLPNLIWLNSHINDIKQEIKPIEINQTIIENCLNGNTVEIQAL